MAGLDFNFDPFKGNDPFGGGRRAVQPRPIYRQPLDEVEAKSVGQMALDAGSSGVSHILGALDKPGQAARGVLAGKGLGSLKHLVPFSHAMGLTTDADSTTGRDLTDKYGITSKHDKGWGAWGAGLAADIATDPLTYTTFGAKHALTGTGKLVEKTGALKGFSGKAMLEGFHGVEPALQASGHSASDITHMLDQGQRIATGAAANTGVKAGQPLGSLVRIGLPFGGPGVNIGTGKAAQKIAGGLDTTADYLKFGNPVGRAVGSLFDHSRHGAVDEITQRGAARYMEPAIKELKRDARHDAFRTIEGLDPLVTAARASGLPESGVTDAARAVAEGVKPIHGAYHASDVSGVAGTIKDIGERQLAEARAAGAPLKDLGEGYVHRSALPESSASLQLGGKKGKGGMFPVTSGSNIARETLYRDIPGSTGRVNDWFGRFAGDADKAKVGAAVRSDLDRDLIANGGLLNLTPAMMNRFDQKAKAMATRLAASSPDRLASATGRGGLFSPDLVADVTQRGTQHARTVSGTKASIGILGDVARPYVKGSSDIPLPVAMKKLGLETTAADLKAGTPMEGALVHMYRSLAKQGVGKVDGFLNGRRSALSKEVGQWGVSPEHFEQLSKQYGKWAAPEPLKSSIRGLDSFTNAFKALAYPIWIPAHVRNAATAAMNNLRHGVGPRDYLDQLQVMTGRGARDLSGIHPSLAGLNGADQLNKLRELQYGGANIFGGHGMNEEISGITKGVVDDTRRFTPQVPGSDRAGAHGNLAADAADLVLKQGLGGSLGAVAKTIRHPTQIGENLGIKGVAGAAADTLPAVSAGRKAGTNIEDFVRGALFNKLSRGGSAPEVASDAINALHFDYDALSGFEKNVMRRVMPFYTYARKNLPLQLDTLAHNPGVLQAQSKPFNQEDPDGKGYVPQYMDSGYAFGLGPEKDGKRQYVSKLGLPAEEAFEKLHFRNGLPDVRRTALSYLGGANPLIKAPLEQLFNTQFHTQRKLSDLHAPQAASAIGKLFGDDNPQLLSQVFANSPATRFVSSADKLLDPRKSWMQKAINLGTGVKVTDVDTDKQRAIDTREALREIMEGHPNLSKYQSFYVKPGDAANLSPQEIELMRAWATQQAEAKVYAKQHKVGIRD